MLTHLSCRNDQSIESFNVCGLLPVGMLDGDLAVALEQKLSRVIGPSEIERSDQGVQFCFVIAAMKRGLDSVLGPHPSGRQQHNAEADLAGIGQCCAIKPGLPKICRGKRGTR